MGERVFSHCGKWEQIGTTSMEVGASLVAQMVKNLPAMQETWFDPWVGKIPWRREWPHTPVFLPGEFQRQKSLVGYSPWGCKDQTRLNN